MKRVVRDCLCGVSGRSGDEAAVVDCGGFRDVVGLENLEGSWEDVDGVGCGEERVEGECFSVESCGDVGFRGFEVELWRRRFVGLTRELASM